MLFSAAVSLAAVGTAVRSNFLLLSKPAGQSTPPFRARGCSSLYFISSRISLLPHHTTEDIKQMLSSGAAASGVARPALGARLAPHCADVLPPGAPWPTPQQLPVVYSEVMSMRRRTWTCAASEPGGQRVLGQEGGSIVAAADADVAPSPPLMRSRPLTQLAHHRQTKQTGLQHHAPGPRKAAPL